MVNKTFLPRARHPARKARRLTFLHFLNWHGFR
jgi:hypothetical protein